MDCILSYHLNPTTCGVARFNAILAQKLGIPLLSVFDDAARNFRAPLVSLKLEEVLPSELSALEQRLQELCNRHAVRAFLHTFDATSIEQKLVREAAIVYCGNAELLRLVTPIRADAIELWCPGTVLSHDLFPAVELSVFSFGMAHKVRSDYYNRLHQLLAGTGKTYALYLSTALHENTSFDDSFNEAFEEIRAIFGQRAYFFGFLSDAAVYNYLLNCTYFAAFFDRGVRGNNTSVNAAMAAGAVVITNLDGDSPTALEHGRNVLDIQRLDELPIDAQLLTTIGACARECATGTLGWPALLAQFDDVESSAPQQQGYLKHGKSSAR